MHDSRDSHDSGDSHGSGDSHDSHHSSESNDSHHSRDLHDSRDSHDSGDSHGSGDSYDSHHSRDSDDSNESTDIGDFNSYLYENSSTKTDEFVLALYAIKLKHNVSNSTIRDVLLLINSILPQSNQCPKSVTCFRKFSYGTSKFHKYCSTCNQIKKTDAMENYTLIKENCCEKELKTFVSFNVKEQLNAILTPAVVSQMRNNLNNAYQNRTEINNAMDGRVYKKYLEKKQNSNLVLSFNLNTDGAPLVKSRTYSLWPLIGTITELNISSRESFKNMVIFGK